LNNLQIFKNENFGEIRTSSVNGEPYVMLNDVCEMLDIKNVSDVKARLKKDGVVNNEVIDRLGRKQVATFINESNLYKVIFQSRKPQAEQFTEWVTSEVLPSIRKNGGYIANQESLTPEQIVAQALIVANNIIQEKDRLLQEQKPKVEFFDTVANSKTALPMDRVAKVLDMGIGRNKLFEILRDKKILDRNNIPYQTYVDRGYFRVVEQKYTKPTGETVVTTKTLVYQRGVDYIRKIVA
jgi:prophage antirepressor-like protein